MKRTQVLKLFLLTTVSFFTYPISSFALITINSPTSSSANNSFTLNYTISESPISGSVSLVFTSAGATRTITMNDSTSANFTINPTLNLATTYAAHITSVSGGTTIPDGVYTVTMSYLNGGGTVNATPVTSVTIDTVTQAPTLTTPAASTTYSGLIPIQYTVPETALSNSKRLIFSNGGTTVTVNLKDSAPTSFNLDPTQDPISNSNVQSASATSIPNGTYTVAFSYQDVLSNAAATSSSTNVVIGASATPTPVVSTPASSDSGGGCGIVSDQSKKKSSMPFELFFWMMICIGFFLILRSKRTMKTNP